MIFIINILVKEPRFIFRRYSGPPIASKIGRFRRKARARAEARRTLLQVSIIGVLVVSAVVGSQFVFGSSFRLSAIASGSMRPTLGIGTLVVVQSVSSPSQIRVGDIVEYNPLTIQGPLVHRVEIDHTGSGPLYTTKGDNNPSPDPASFPFGRVIGKVVFSIPLVGYLVLSPPLAVALIAFLFLSSVFGSEFKRAKRGRVGLV
jgi:signal peptidase I